MMTNSVNVSKHRADFFETLNSDSFNAVLKKYGEHGITFNIKKFVKGFLFRTRLFDYYTERKMR